MGGKEQGIRGMKMPFNANMSLAHAGVNPSYICIYIDSYYICIYTQMFICMGHIYNTYTYVHSICRRDMNHPGFITATQKVAGIQKLAEPG